MKPVTASIDQYLIEILPLNDKIQLKQQWLLLEKENDVPFFLTWSWIGTWLDTFYPDVIIVTAKYENEIVAIGVFSYAKVRRKIIIRSHQLNLHQTGMKWIDQICIEYNDFICRDSHRNDAVAACLKALQFNFTAWDEIIICMMKSSNAQQILQQVPHSKIIDHSPCYAINLDNIRVKQDNYLQSLSSNTRYQIRRSIREYESSHGKITLSTAQTSEQALDLFQLAGEFQLLRWKNGSNINPFFVSFHAKLIKQCVESNGVELLQVKSGDTVIAVIYNFIVGRSVYFYLQGLKYEQNSKLKPGLVAHAMIAQHYIDKGMAVYDFLAGQSQYKTQLAKPTEDLISIRIQKPYNLLFAIESIVHQLKMFYRKTVKNRK